MSLEYFHVHFPEVARAEMRSVNVVDEDEEGLPADSYGLVESYCTDPACDCRRVMLHVFSLKRGPEATISLGLDKHGPLPGSFLDPLNTQREYAEELLDLVQSIALTPEYLARLERHYHLMKDKFGRPTKGKPKPGAAEKWWKKKRRKWR